ncbi:unnamed protein product, partial [Symbiodinium necroappetens]
TKVLLQRLAASPLVRRSLPNAAAICQQYFSFKRQPQESIGNFLVRETLVHEEFVEAIIRLHEEKLGVSQADRDFGLPEETEWRDDADWNSWYDGGSWGMEDPDDPDSRPLPPDGDSPQVDGEPAAPPERRDDHPQEPAPTRGATGSSPSHRQADAGSTTGSRHGETPPVTKTPLDEMSIADSFIMDVLRGWRLLQAAGLSAEEKDYPVISSALQSLWDDQLLGGHRLSHGPFNAHYLDAPDENYANYQHEYDDWWQDDDSWWYDDSYDDVYAVDQWREDDWHHEGQHAMTPEPEDPEAMAKLQEAQSAERIAESLAAEATRTWTEAQRATQALRRDRGFGSPSNNPAAGKCFLCGGNHFARECPDRRHPGGKGRGKGYFRNFAADMDDAYAYYFNKGKGKGKSKSKKGMVLEAQAWMKGKKSRMKGSGKDATSGHRSVNAYATDLFLGGLEVSEAMAAGDSQAAPSTGMIDCGATASAAPEAVVRSLIAAVLT